MRITSEEKAEYKRAKRLEEAREWLKNTLIEFRRSLPDEIVLKLFAFSDQEISRKRLEGHLYDVKQGIFRAFAKSKAKRIELMMESNRRARR